MLDLFFSVATCYLLCYTRTHVFRGGSKTALGAWSIRTSEMIYVIAEYARMIQRNIIEYILINRFWITNIIFSFSGGLKEIKTKVLYLHPRNHALLEAREGTRQETSVLTFGN